MTHLDVEFRFKLECEIISTLICFDPNKTTIKEDLYKNGIIARDFSDKRNKLLFNAILDCYEKDIIPDLIALQKYKPTNSTQADWDKYVITLIQLASSSANFEHHLTLLKEFVLKEYWYNFILENYTLYWDKTDILKFSDDTIDGYNRLYLRFTERMTKIGGIAPKDDYEREITLKYLNNQQGKKSLIPTGNIEVDELLKGGLSFGELIILAGRPGMMKTTIALILAWGVAKLGYPVAFFSLEMPANQLRNKIVSLETGIDYHDLKKGRISSSELGLVSNVNKKINELQFFIIEDCKTIEEIAQRTNELVTKFSVKLGVLDYIQRCKISKIDNLREGTTKITRELKSMAKDNYIPIIALSQLSRAVESRTNKRPILSDLKESGSIEEDADIVIFPFRQAYYNLLENRPVPDNEMWKTELNIGKGRDIGTAHRAIVDVNPVKMTITDWQPFQVVKKS